MDTNKPYTSGPWTVEHGWNLDGSPREKGKNYFPSVILSNGKGQFKPFHNGRPALIVNESHDQEKESIMANAFLIAAAPELLESLQEIVGIAIDRWRPLPADSHEKKTLNKARAVIQKALNKD